MAGETLDQSARGELPERAAHAGTDAIPSGKVAEATSGVTLDVAIKDGVTGQLGMNGTTFLMDDAQRAQSSPVHVKGEDGRWSSAGEILNQEPDWFAGGHGLYGTPRDYITFERALLRGGALYAAL